MFKKHLNKASIFNNWKNGALLFLISIIGCWPAFYNGFPLVTSDTGTYISSGFLGVVPIDRPIFYGLIIRHLSLSASLWIIVLFQSFVGTILIYYTLNILALEKNIRFVYTTIIICILSYFTSYSWFTSQLMPDIYTGYIILFLASFIVRKDSIKVSEWLLYAITIYFIAVHNSNLISVTIISLVFLLVYRVKIRFSLKLQKKRILAFSLAPILSLILILSINYSFDKKFSVSKGSHVFLMARLAENGILDAYLKENCFDLNDYKLCAYKDNIPVFAFQFIWDPQGVLANTGGWENSKDEYNKIIIETIKKPKYLKLHFIESIKGTFKQFIQIDVGSGMSSFAENSPPFENIKQFFNEEIKEYRSAKQMYSLLPKWESFNFYFRLLFTISFITGILLLLTNTDKLKIPLELKIVYLVCFLGLFANAFVCGTFANVLDRLQSRCAWIIIVPAILTLMQYKRSRG